MLFDDHELREPLSNADHIGASRATVLYPRFLFNILVSPHIFSFFLFEEVLNHSHVTQPQFAWAVVATPDRLSPLWLPSPLRRLETQLIDSMAALLTLFRVQQLINDDWFGGIALGSGGVRFRATLLFETFLSFPIKLSPYLPLLV